MSFARCTAGLPRIASAVVLCCSLYAGPQQAAAWHSTTDMEYAARSCSIRPSRPDLPTCEAG